MFIRDINWFSTLKKELLFCGGEDRKHYLISKIFVSNILKKDENLGVLYQYRKYISSIVNRQNIIYRLLTILILYATLELNHYTLFLMYLCIAIL
jgi:hypothetical protein